MCVVALFTGCAAQAGNVPRPGLIRVGIGTGCPSDLDGAEDVANPATYPRLIPDGVWPESGLICGYEPTPPSLPAAPIPGPFDSSARTQVSLYAASARAIAEAISALTVGSGAGAADCPDDRSGQAAIIVLHYAGEPDLDLWYHDSGCMSLDDGMQSAPAVAGAYFYSGFAATVELVAGIP